ncbi:MAG: oligosaccharide flippase family protein [Actinobacteria bacterium]|nr:oligosaccharide flippase family protein [Actinomycetota bacterium]
MKTDQRKVGIVLSYAFTGTNMLVGFIYIPLLIHFLGKDEYGLYQLMGSFIVYLSLFDFGLSSTITRYYSRYIALNDEKGKENLLALSTIIYTVLAGILLIIGTVFYFFIDEIFTNSLTDPQIMSAKSMYLIILLTVVFTLSTSVFNSVINANEKFIFLRLLSIVQTVFRPILVLAVFTLEASALIVVSVQAFINVFGVLLKIYYSFKKLEIKAHLHFWDRPLIQEMLKYSFFIFITALMDQIFWRSDQVILGILVDTESVAIYSIASQILMNYMTLSTAMSGVFLPSISKKVVEKCSNDELSAIFIKIGRLQYVLLGGVLSGFILFGKEFIAIWVGVNFMQAYYITLLIMVPFTIDLIQNIGLAILQAKNMHIFRAIIFLIMSIINVLFSIPLALNFGGIGTAFATSVTYFLGNGLIMNYYYYRKVKLDVIRFWKEIFKLSTPIFVSLILGVLINHINFENLVISILLKIKLFTLIYGVTVWKIGLNSYEKDLVSRPFKKLINV